MHHLTLFLFKYPTGWTSIDGDEYVSNDREGTKNPFEGRASVMPEPNGEHEITEVLDNIKPVARGVSGLPLDQTKAVVGAKRAQITCDHDVSKLAYWNEPQGDRDYSFMTPYQDKTPGLKPKYLAFSMDPGGFNNIRWVFIFAKKYHLCYTVFFY